MLSNKSLSLALAVCLLAPGCAPTIPNLKKSVIPLPESFPLGHSSDPSSAEVLWKEFYKDVNLNTLVETAIKNNQELSILEQEINIANNEVMARQGEYIPKFNAGATGGVEKIERFSNETANSRTKFGRLGVTTSWEIDIWKKLRNASKAAYFNYLASIESRRYLITNLVAEVANTYFELMAIDNQIDVVKSYVEILSQITNMVDLQQQAGRVTSLPVKRFGAEVYKNQARQLELQQRLIVTQNRLNLLLGRYPQDISREHKEFTKYTFTNIKTSVPTKLLENRPDVKKASLELEAAKLSVKVAKARFYPALSIEGSYGYEQFNSKHFEGTPTSIFYGIAANLTAPILNRKAIKADYLSANNKQVQAVYNYEKTLIQAYSEVVNQINMIKNYDQVFEMKSNQVKTLNESIEISNELFRAARVDYVEALLTQRDALEAQIDLIDVKKNQLSGYVNLYKALGGGWKGLEEKSVSNY